MTIEKAVEIVEIAIGCDGKLSINEDRKELRARGFIEGFESRQGEIEELKKKVEKLRQALEDIIRYSDKPFKGDKWDKERKLIAKEILKETEGK